MQSHHAVENHEHTPLLARVVQFVRAQHQQDTFVLVGLPVLIVLGGILGVINLLACIHLIAVLLNG